MDISKYEEIAKKHKMNNIILISPEDIYFDKRARLKCRWGCDSSNGTTIKCEDRGFSVDEAEETIKKYEALSKGKTREEKRALISQFIEEVSNKK